MCASLWPPNGRSSGNGRRRAATRPSFRQKGRVTLVGKRPWYAEGLRFSCTRCAACCSGPPGYVWFDDAQGQTMADYLKMSLADFRRFFAHTVGGRWTLNEKRSPLGSYDCVFLRRDGDANPTCSIYPVRPLQCRTWPFWPENLKGPPAWRALAQRCPGVAAGSQGQGRLFVLTEIEKQRAMTP